MTVHITLIGVLAVTGAIAAAVVITYIVVGLIIMLTWGR